MRDVARPSLIDVKKVGLGYTNANNFPTVDFCHKACYNEKNESEGGEGMTYEEAYKKYRRRIESFCLYKLDGGDGQLAEDLCSEVFLLLYMKWDALDTHEEARVLKWLYNTALIKVREHRRLASKKPLVYSLEDYNTPDAVPCEALTYLDTQADDELVYRQYLEQIKATLSPKDRQTFVLKVEKQYTVAQIAKELQENEVTVKVRWYRIQKRLKEKIQDFLK